MPEPEIPELVKVARDLREIETLSEQLPAEAAHKGADSTVMAMLGPVANLEAWQHRIDTAWERHLAECERESCRDCDVTPHVDDHDPEWEPPLQTLAYWSEQWRVQHNRESDRRPTVATEAAYLRSVLDWAWDHEPHWDDFAADVRKARLRVEDELRAGTRAERTRTPCVNPDCQTKPRLIKVYRGQAAHDFYKCPACKWRYDADAFTRAQHVHMADEAAGWVKLADALAVIDRPERTVRQWLADNRVWRYCDLTTRQVWLWWPDLYDLRLDPPTRGRPRSA